MARVAIPRTEQQKEEEEPALSATACPRGGCDKLQSKKEKIVTKMSIMQLVASCLFKDQYLNRHTSA